MGLLGVLRKIKRKEKQMRILMLGLDNAGKTTVVKQFSGEDVNEVRCRARARTPPVSISLTVRTDQPDSRLSNIDV